MSDAELDATLDEYDGCVRDLAQLSTQGMSDIALATQADNARDRIVAAFAAARREVETVTRERDAAQLLSARLRGALQDIARHWNDDMPVFEHTHQLYAAAMIAQLALAQEAGDA